MFKVGDIVVRTMTGALYLRARQKGYIFKIMKIRMDQQCLCHSSFYHKDYLLRLAFPIEILTYHLLDELDSL